MKKEMLINVLQPEECRIAIVEDGQLEELYVERASQESYVGNIYKGKIVNIEQGIQAAFVDFGIGRNGFLHVTDVDPMYYKHLLPKELQAELDDLGNDDGGSRGPRRERAPRRDRGDREDRGQRRGPLVAEDEVQQREVMSTFLPPQEAPQGTTIAEAFGEDVAENIEEAEGFLEGLDEIEAPQPPLIRRMPVEVTTVPPPAPKPRPIPAPPAPVAEDDDEDDSGFGSGLDMDEDESTDGVVELTESDESGETEDTGEKKKKKTTGVKKAKPTKGTKKADDKTKTKSKKPVKKKSDDSKPMESTERRTSPDDEPEIQPFFTDDAGGFDIDAPNDRFAPEPRNEDSNGFESDDESEDPLDLPPVSKKTEEFTDEDLAELDAAAERRFRESKQDGRGGARGDRGGRGGDRGGRGDRGPRRDDRGDRGPRRDDRGPRREGGERGPRRDGGDRGPGGPSSVQNKSHTRHKGLPIPKIQDIFKRGQEVIVQVIKEGIGTKGPALSTFISIAGRYLVLMPSLNRVGVSKKIEDRDARHRLRDIMNDLNPPKGVGFIVRTAAVDRDETELRNDLTYLLRLWQVVVRRIKRPGPVEVYRESDMITRTIRDIFTGDIDTIFVDEEKAFAHASEFLQIVMPKYAGRIRYYGDTEPLFHRYRIEDEIAKINHKRLDLPGGGSIIIEQTEALVSIDVNSGNFRAEGHLEETAFQMNQRAAKEIARQLRLRDLGGVIVNDFIDMRSESHRRQVEETLRNALRRDRARTKILRISEFGLIEMTRQRMQPSLKKRVFNDCSHCSGTGFIKNHETMAIEVMRQLQLSAHRCPPGTNVAIVVHPDVAYFVLNRKRREIGELESKLSMEVSIVGKPGASPELLEFRCTDPNGNEVRLNASPPPARAGRIGPANHDRRHQDDV
jgi:ribonuclease E